jgi:DNA-binding IclR family transcriptional regulator
LILANRRFERTMDCNCFWHVEPVPRMVSKPKYSAPALEKGLDIIEYLSGRDAGETLTSIATGIGRSNNEIFRMLLVLEERGFVDKLPESDRYLMTDKLFHLGLSQPRKKNLMKLAIPAMEAFASECHSACHLSVLAGNEVVVVTRVESPLNVGIAVRVGHRLPLAHAPSGLCITAFSRPDEIDAIVANVKKSDGLKRAKIFKAAIDEISQLGYCIMKDGFSVGVTGLSAPIVDLETGQCIAAMTSPVLQYVTLKNTDLHKIASSLRFHADTVSSHYGNRKAETEGQEHE